MLSDELAEVLLSRVNERHCGVTAIFNLGKEWPTIEIAKSYIWNAERELVTVTNKKHFMPTY